MRRSQPHSHLEEGVSRKGPKPEGVFLVPGTRRRLVGSGDDSQGRGRPLIEGEAGPWGGRAMGRRGRVQECVAGGLRSLWRV